MVSCRRNAKKGDEAGEHKLDPQTASEKGSLEGPEGKIEYYPRMRANDRNRQTQRQYDKELRQQGILELVV
jgi:hypothetical protein